MIKGFDLFQLLIQQYRWRVSNFGIFLSSKVNYDVFERAIKSGAKFVEWERFDQVQHSIQKLYPLTKSGKATCLSGQTIPSIIFVDLVKGYNFCIEC